MSRGDVERSETEGIGLWPKARGGREVHHWRPIRADVGHPRRFFGGFLIAQKATRRRGGEIPLKSNGAVQNRREGQAPPLCGNVPHMSRNRRVWDPSLRWGKGCGAPTGVRAHGARPSPILKETPGPPNGRPGGLDHDVFTFRRGRPRRRP